MTILFWTGVGLFATSVIGLCWFAYEASKAPEEPICVHKRKAWAGQIDYSIINRDQIARRERMRMH